MALIDWGMTMQEAVALPHILNRNGATELEAGTAAVRLAPALAAMGHAVKIVPLESGLEGIRIVDGHGWRHRPAPRGLRCDQRAVTPARLRRLRAGRADPA